MRRAVPFLSLLLLFLLSGCQEAQTQKLIRRPKYYQKIVSLSPSTTEILVSALQKYQLAGRTSADNWPATVKDQPIVASLKPDYEKLANIRPDLIVLDGDLFGEADKAKLKELGADMFAFNAQNLDDFETQIYKLASLVGGETAASAYIDKIHVALNTAEATPPTPKPRVAVVMPSPNGDHMIAGVDSFQADLVKRVGGEPVGPQGTMFVKANPESLVTLNPDVIIVNGSKTDVSGAMALLRDPRLKGIAAIKNSRVKVLDSDVLLRKGGRVDLLVDGLYRAISAR